MTLNAMSMKKWLLISFLLLEISLLQAAPVTLKGKAPLLAGKTIQLIRTADFITQSEEVLETVVVSGDGSFTLTTECTATGQYMLRIGFNTHLLYLRPGMTYVLEIPDPGGEELFYPEMNDSTETMYLVARLTHDFNSFNINNYEKFIAGTVRNDAAKFIQEEQARYNWLTDPFVIASRDYKIAALQYTTRLKGAKVLFETWLRDKPVLYRHPEYMGFFNEFYEGLMLQLIGSNKHPQVRQIIKDGTPYDSLLVHVQADELVQKKEIAELFILKGLFELYYKTGFDRYKIENLLGEQEARTTEPEIRNIIQQFRRIITRLRPGSPFIPFSGKKPDGTEVDLGTLTDKPIYLTFFAPDDPRSMEEIPGIANLYERYRKEVQFISVCTNCTYTSLQGFMTKYKIQWTCLLADAQAETDYEVLQYPAAFLIDREGVFKESPARLPSEGAELQLYRVTKKGRNDNR